MHKKSLTAMKNLKNFSRGDTLRACFKGRGREPESRGRIEKKKRRRGKEEGEGTGKGTGRKMGIARSLVSA